MGRKIKTCKDTQIYDKKIRNVFESNLNMQIKY